MAKPQKPQRKPKTSSTKGWVIRIMVFGVLGIALVLAYMDFNKKNQATETGVVWRELFSDFDKNAMGNLSIKKLEEAKVGSPTLTENKLENVYTWKGPFREYVIKVSYGIGGSKPVEGIEGP